MKKILLLSFLCIFAFSQNLTATPVDIKKKDTPIGVRVQPKKKKKKFFTRMTEKIMKRRVRKMLKKLNLASSDCARIVKKNGEEIEVLIIKIGEDRIRYKNCDFQNGPTRSIRKEDIFMIKYADGKTELVAEKEAIKKKEREELEAVNPKKIDYKQYWYIGFFLGIFLGIFSLIILAIVLTGKKRKHALKGALAGMLTVILFIIFLALLFLS
ncbi:MAG: hypothetical protein AB8F94_08820, partial [Saprospiraceae bacterium]